MKKKMIRLAASAVLAGFALTVNSVFDFQYKNFVVLGLFVCAYLLAGLFVVIDAVKNLFSGNLLDENFLMAIASVGAFCIGEYTEAVAVMIFFGVGEMFENYAVKRSRRSIAELMNIRPDYANLVCEGSEGYRSVSPETVNPGDIIRVFAGEKIPLDGIVVSGHTTVDTSALTGESVPQDVGEGMEILSGCVNRSGLIDISVTKEFGESTVSKILELVENAQTKKSKSENFITAFSAIYTPVVVCAAVLIAVIPSIITGNFTEWLYRALNFLVVSCPCALVISVPLSFFGGLGGASRHGVLIKGSNYLEVLAKTETVIFDKTGTLTSGVFEVVKIEPSKSLTEPLGEEGAKVRLLELAAYAENYSSHPISVSLKKAYGKPIDASRISDCEEISGKGIRTLVDGKRIFVGKPQTADDEFKSDVECGTVVEVLCEDKYLGYIVISDIVKEDSIVAIKRLRQNGVKRIVMLTGDNKKAAESVAKLIGVDECYSGLLPSEKVSIAEKIILSKDKKSAVAFVGDGINDAPVLARADVGISMGAMGSDAAIEASDVVIMNDEPSKLPEAMNIARRTLKIAYQNITFAITVKLVILALCALGFCGMWAAVFADVGVSVLAILNSLRALK